MIFASLGWVSSYTLLCLILRTGEEKISALNKGEPKIQGLSDHLQSEAEAICQALTYNTEYFKHLAQRLESPDVEPTDEYICKTMNSCLIEFLRFSYELLFHCNLGFNDVNNQIHSRNIDLDNVLRLVGINAQNINVPGKANYWTRAFRTQLTNMAKLKRIFQPCIVEPLAWKPRRILKPPTNFDELFGRYFHRECNKCSSVPSYPVMCLFCGEILCLNDCCRMAHQESGSDRVISMSEIEAHAEDCSSSSGLFLSVTSSMVVVSRGKQAAIWGTIYLDAHKEEDRNLKRGKPLFLCESRLKWLEYDWAEQEWQRVPQWFNMTNSQAFTSNIRDCHLFQR